MEKSVNQSECCKATLENGLQCNQNSTLAIFAELNHVYQQKLESVDGSPGDGIETKDSVYCAWVTDLLLQNAQLISTVEELEKVACNRLHLLENKLDASSGNYCSIIGLQKNIKNLLEVIRRVRDERVWDLTGLDFIGITAEDILGINTDLKSSEASELPYIKNSENISIQNKFSEESLGHEGDLYHDTNMLIHDLRQANLDIEIELSKSFEEKKALKETIAELNAKLAKCTDEKKSFEKMVADIPGLVMEVAEKHDTILQYRREISEMEEQLKLKDTHIHFKEQIIKDLRRECKKVICPRTNESSAGSATSATNTTVINAKHPYRVKTKKKVYISDDETDDMMNEFVDKLDKASDLSQNQLDVEIDELIKYKNRTINEQKLMIEKLNDKINKTDATKLLHLFDFVLRSMHKDQLSDHDTTPSNETMYVSNIFCEAIDGLKLNYQVVEQGQYNFPDESIVKIKNSINLFHNALTVLKVENSQLGQYLNDLKSENKDGSSSTGKRSHSDEFLLVDESDSLSNISIFRQSMKNHIHDKLKAQKCVCGYMLLDLAELFSKILGKQLTNESLSEVKNGNIGPINNLMIDLQQEIVAKDCLLNTRNEKILLLEDDLKIYKKDLFEIRRKLETISKERLCEKETIDNLKLALTAHVDTITQLQKTNEKLQKDQASLQESLSEQSNACLIHMKKLDKFEQECEQQLCTITNLRSALEKRVGGSSHSSSKKSSRSHRSTDNNGAWCWWRNVYDV